MKYRPLHLKGDKTEYKLDRVLLGLVGLDTFLATLVISILIYVS